MTRSNIARELRQSRPFTSPHTEVTVALMRTVDVVRTRLAAALATSGLTAQQYNVLRILRGAGTDGLPTLDIADRMVERTPGITRLLDRLISKGLVERERSTEDRRVVFARITADGTALLAKLDEPIAAADRAAVGKLRKKDFRTLLSLLDAIRAE